MIREAILYHELGYGKVHCYLCNHHCKIADSKFGFCGVRQNKGGMLYTHAYGEVIAANIDPVEKKPLYHFLPGEPSLSVATRGCNFRCDFCQNWEISQDSNQNPSARAGQTLLPEEIIQQAQEHHCRIIAYTYTEPTIFFEYALDTAKLAREEGMYNVFVTNGYMTQEALDIIHPYLDACNVDLKSFNEDFYRKVCRGHLRPVLDSIRHMKELNIWVEITTLVIPGSNDSEEELGNLVRFIAELDPAIPWHMSRFHPDYRFAESQATPLSTLKKACELGKEVGLQHIYIGNVPGEAEDTLCPECQKVLIRRKGFIIRENAVKDSGCPYCGAPLAGIFDQQLENVKTMAI